MQTLTYYVVFLQLEFSNIRHNSKQNPCLQTQFLNLLKEQRGPWQLLSTN